MKYVFLVFLSMQVFAAKIPKNAHPVDQYLGWECNRGYIQHRELCVKVKVPKNGVLNEDGHTWSCKPGYEKYRDVCHKPKKK